ncbi:MAG: class I SAM-dependent methyltransferase [Minisyncoccia bacterium]
MNSERIYSSIGRVAGLYDIALKLSGYQSSVEFFVSQLPFPKDTQISVLDAGCGTGLYTLALLKRYPNARVVAFDLNEKLVGRLKEKLVDGNYQNRVRVFTGDIQNPPSGEYDLIITAGVLEYVPLQQTAARLALQLRAGRYFFNSPVRDTLWGQIVAGIYGCKLYSREENMSAFEPVLRLEKIITLPSYALSSFKEGHLFKKPGRSE